MRARRGFTLLVLLLMPVGASAPQLAHVDAVRAGSGSCEGHLSGGACDGVVKVVSRYPSGLHYLADGNVVRLRSETSTGTAIDSGRRVVVSLRNIEHQPLELFVLGNDGRRYDAVVEWKDRSLDLAVLALASDEALPSWTVLDLRDAHPSGAVVRVSRSGGTGDRVDRGDVLPGSYSPESGMIDVARGRVAGASGEPVFDRQQRVVGFTSTFVYACAGAAQAKASTPRAACSRVVTAARFCERYGRCQDSAAPRVLAHRDG